MVEKDSFPIVSPFVFQETAVLKDSGDNTVDKEKGFKTKPNKN